MSLNYNYGTLLAALQAWSDINSPDSTANMADVMQKGELRLYHSLDLDNLDPVLTSGNASGATGLITKPPTLIRERIMTLVPGTTTGPGGTPVFADPTDMLLHFDGGNGSNVVIDSSGNNLVPSANGLITQSTTQAKFGVSSLAGNGITIGTGLGYVSVPSPAGGVLDMSLNSQWTIEFWVYLPLVSGLPSGYGSSFNNISYFDMSFNQTTGVAVWGAGAGNGTFNLRTIIAGTYNVTYVTSSPANTNLQAWNHVAVVRLPTGGIQLFVNGVSQVVTPSSPGTYPAWGGTLNIGARYDANPGALNFLPLGCYIDEFRVSSVAQYTANFTPPAAPFSATPSIAGGGISLVRRSTPDFVQQYLIDNGLNTGPPKYYAEWTATQWLLAPVPDQPYYINVRGVFRPQLLGDSPEVTNLAGIAVAAHTIAATPMTLTTQPFIYANVSAPLLQSSQLWLFSAGNMSANNFTIIGLDDDGNAQTEVIAGPNAGSVQSVGVYSQITSITPSATDAVNFVSAGWSQDNYTWLSTRFPDLLFYACLSELCHFNKRWSAQAQAEAKLKELMEPALLVTGSLRRNDIDDIFMRRQNVSAPGSSEEIFSKLGGQQQAGQRSMGADQG